LGEFGALPIEFEKFQMKRFVRGLLAVIVYCIFKTTHRNTEFLVIETNIFGHAVLESVLLRKYVSVHPEKRVRFITHRHSANYSLTNSIRKTLKADGVKESYFGRLAMHAQEILKNRMNVPPKIKIIAFQEDLTHLTASNQDSNLLPEFSITILPNNEALTQSKRNILLMNRSSAYVKHNESVELHSYRNFSFESIDRSVPKNFFSFNFIRIGKFDQNTTSNVRIFDVRREIESNPALDMSIQAHSYAYFGADSGPAWYALCAHKPVAFTNMIPLNQVSPTDCRKLVVIPKLLYSLDLGRVLTLSEMLSAEISLLRSSEQYKNSNLVPIENSHEDVEKFMTSWLNMLDNSGEALVDEEFMNALRRKHDVPFLPSISANFIRDHSEIL
jgi:putative glycosyltransferase (TIGR04372 family)